MAREIKKPTYEELEFRFQNYCRHDASHLVKEMLVLTVGIYPNGEYKTNTVPVSDLEMHVRYNIMHRPGRALFIKYPDGTVICISEGSCSQEVLRRVSKTIYDMPIGNEDSAPYH